MQKYKIKSKIKNVSCIFFLSSIYYLDENHHTDISVSRTVLAIKTPLTDNAPSSNSFFPIWTKLVPVHVINKQHMLAFYMYPIECQIFNFVLPNCTFHLFLYQIQSTELCLEIIQDYTAKDFSLFAVLTTADFYSHNSQFHFLSHNPNDMKQWHATFSCLSSTA